MGTVERDVRHRFTLLEVLVSVGVIAVLIGLVLPLLGESKKRAKQAACLNHVRNISSAIQMYHNDYEAYPAHDFLSVALGKYYDNTNDAWECPETRMSYELYYVPRGIGEEYDQRAERLDNYFVGCPKHRIVNFAPGKGTKTFHAGRILHDGKEVEPGSVVTDGTLAFADGSTAELSGKAMILTSIRTGDGRLYTILRVLSDYGDTTIDVTVPSDANPKSKFEIVTPASIAGVVGTVFKVKATMSEEDVETWLTVIEGTVDLTGPYAVSVRVKGGDAKVKVKVKKQKCHGKPPKGKGKDKDDD